MAVVKSPKNAKHKKLWTRKLSCQILNKHSVNTLPINKTSKPYTKVYSWNKPDMYFKKIVKHSLLKNVLNIKRISYRC